jgi:1,4-dihydroxy-2-naphthoate octaprenyltransferase
VAAVAGTVLAASTTWWLLAVGAACILAGWFYTGGPRPYGYSGFGELFVFVFFGLVATAGTTYVQTDAISRRALVAAVGVGLLATAMLVVNNLRDIPTDTASDKRTLAVRLGDPLTRVLYYACVVTPIAAALAVGAWPALLTLAVAVPVIQMVRGGATGRSLVPVLVRTGQVQLVYGALLAVGIVLS